MKSVTTLFTVIYLSLAVLGFVGWVKSIVKFCQCDFEPNYKAEIIYGVSAVTGIGAVTGWMEFGK